MFRYFSLLSWESFKSSVVVEDSNFSYSTRWLVKTFRFRHEIGRLGAPLLGARKLFHEARLKGYACRWTCRAGRHTIARPRLPRTWSRRSEHLALPIHQPTHVDLREAFVNVVDCIECRFSSSAEDARECAFGYAYFCSKNFLRHTHVFH